MHKMLPSNGPLHKQPNTRKECGAVLSELAISLPLLLIMFVGIFEVGRHLAQVSALVQTSFNAAYYGAGLQSSSSQAVVDRAYLDLFQNFHSREFQSGGSNSFTVSYLPSPSAPTEIKLSFNWSLRDLLGPISPLQIPLSQSVDFTVPMLVRQATPLTLNQFQNVATGLYDQDGSFYAGCFDCSCLPSQCL